MEEMRAMKDLLCQVQLLIDGNGEKSNHCRLTMISVKHLITMVTGCFVVCSRLDKSLSEVQGISDPFSKTNTGKNLVERVRWAAWKEDEVFVMLGDLQRHKLSLNLMLSIIQW
jgi:hypothetical protein